MKVRKLVKRLYRAVREGKLEKEKRLYIKLLKKSFKGKKTFVVR